MASRSLPDVRSSIRLPVQAIVVDRALFQEWSRAGYEVVWDVPEGTPMFDYQEAQYVFGHTGPLTSPPLPPADLNLSWLPPSGSPDDFPGPAPSWRGLPMSSPGVASGGDEREEGSPYRQPSPASQTLSDGPRASFLPGSPRPRSAPPLTAIPSSGLVPSPSPSPSPPPSTPRQPWPVSSPSSPSASSPAQSMPASSPPGRASSPALPTSPMNAKNQDSEPVVRAPVNSEPDCHIDEPDDEKPQWAKKNKGKKPVYQVTEADQPYFSDSDDNLFVSPTIPTPPSTESEQQQKPQAQPQQQQQQEEQWEEYSAEKWERATPQNDQPASTGYSLQGTSLSNTVHAMPRLADLGDARAVPPAETNDRDEETATTVADSDSDNESDPGPNTQITGIDWRKLHHNKPVSELGAEEREFLRTTLVAHGVYQERQRALKVKNSAEIVAKMKEIKELRQEMRLRELSQQNNGQPSESASLQKQGAEEAKTQALTRTEKRSLMKQQAAIRKKAEKAEKEAEEEAKRKAAAAKREARDASKSKDGTQQKPAPASQRVGGRRVAKKRPAKPEPEQSFDKVEVQIMEETTVTEERDQHSEALCRKVRKLDTIAETTGKEEPASRVDLIYANYLRKLIKDGAEKVSTDDSVDEVKT